MDIIDQVTKLIIRNPQNPLILILKAPFFTLCSQGLTLRLDFGLSARLLCVLLALLQLPCSRQGAWGLGFRVYMA